MSHRPRRALPGSTRIAPGATVIAAILLAVIPSTATSQALNPNLPVTNGGVEAIAVADGKVYIGGAFDRVGPATGGFVGIDAAGKPLAPYPRVAGTVNCLAPDGAGGWFIGGTFTSVGGQPRRNLAQIDASGAVTAWNPGAEGEVDALLLYGSTLYVGGNFATLGGQNRSRLGALDATTGVTTPWNPGANNYVNALVARSSATAGSSRLYVGGGFTTMAGQTRTFVAAFNPDDGSLTSWSPTLDGIVLAMAIQAPRFGTPLLYIGGGFQNVGSQPRSRLAAFNLNTESLTSWNPAPNNSVAAILAPNGGPIFVAGGFTAIGSGARRFLASLDQSTGVITGWDPNPDLQVTSLLLYNGVVYAGGQFSRIGGQNRRGLAELDATFGLATTWDPSPNSAVISALGANDSGIFVGGGFTSLGGVTRNGLAAFQIPNGTIDAWDPNVSYNGNWGTVSAMQIQGGSMYFGGLFTSVGGQARNALAAVDLISGLPTSWNPDAANSVIHALAISGGTVYVGGQLTTVGGQIRTGAAAVDLATGAVTPWAPSMTGYENGEGVNVEDIVPSGNTLYLGGDFITVNGQFRHGLAAVDAAMLGYLLPWSPSTGHAWVNAIAVDGSRAIVGGSFTTMGGRPRSNLAILDLPSGLATTLDPYVSGEVRALALDGSTLYVGGDYASIGLESRLTLGAIDVRDGSVLPWDPGDGGAPMTFAITGDGIYVGGGFYGVGGVAQSNLAGFSRTLTGVEVADGGPAPEAPSRLRIAPNPFRDQTTLTFATRGTEPIQVDVYDASGRRVRRISERAPGSGSTSFVWDGRSDAGTPAGAGIYFVRARSGDALHTAKILLVK